MTKIEEQIEQIRSSLADLKSGKFHYIDAAGNLDTQMQADQIATCEYVLAAYDAFIFRGRAL